LGAHANLADRYFHASGVPHEWRYDEEYDDGRMLHAPIGSYTPNAFGLHDMHGNVAEWCLDGDTDYRRDAAVPGTGHRPMKDEGVTRVRRGGGFMSIAERARSGCRIDADWDARDSAAGCRAARNLDK
jgi:formylglycine-generating enzyme required for sulfatase activity